jgi:hypothetical protein
VHSAFSATVDEPEFFQRMIEERRMVVRLHVRRLYGVAMSAPPGS